jgi:hypothetical protein
MVMSLQTAAEPITGWFVTAGMTTLVDDVGKIPPHQLPGVFQSVFVAPVQVPVVHDAPETVTIPVAVLKKKVSSWYVDDAELLPHVPLDFPTPPSDKVPAV